MLMIMYRGSFSKVEMQLKKMLEVDNKNIDFREITDTINYAIKNDFIMTHSFILLSDNHNIRSHYADYIIKSSHNVHLNSFSAENYISDIMKLNRNIKILTNSLFENTFNDNIINSDVKCALVNVVYFNIIPKNSFPYYEKTSTKLFMIQENVKYNFYQDNIFKLIEIPTAEQNIYLGICIGSKDIKHISAHINDTKLKYFDVVKIPKLQMYSKFNLKNLITLMGTDLGQEQQSELCFENIEVNSVIQHIGINVGTNTSRISAYNKIFSGNSFLANSCTFYLRNKNIFLAWGYVD